MANYLIEENSLYAIGDALRRKHGETKPAMIPATQSFYRTTDDLSEFNTKMSGNGKYQQWYIYDEVICPEGWAKVKFVFDETSNYLNGLRIYRDSYETYWSDLKQYEVEYTSQYISRLRLYWQVTEPSVALPWPQYYGAEVFFYDADGNLITEMPVDVPNTYLVSEMADAIDEIIPYVEPVVESIEITANGTYTPSAGVDGFNEVNVNIDIPTGGIPDEALHLTGTSSYKFAYGGWDWFINLYGDKITTENLTTPIYMFKNSKVERIPFKLNIQNKTAGEDYANMFADCINLKEVPELSYAACSGMTNIFSNCHSLRYIPEDLEDCFDWAPMETATSTYGGNRGSMFDSCYSLRSAPMGFLNHGNPNASSATYLIYYNLFRYCYALDEVIGLPFPHYKANLTSSAFTYSFNSCYRLKELTFALQDDGTPYTVNWSKQTLDLTNNVGVAGVRTYITTYNSGITEDKEVKDDATYQALKDDADWWTVKADYSRYNHTSAVNTINSLPITTGTGNTIKFKGAAGAKTDGGAINTLTEEEIAVAAAKGWTVTLL